MQENLANLTDEDLIKAVRVKGEADLFFFVKEICEFGHNPDPNGPRVGEDQKELCEWLQKTFESGDPNTWLSLLLAPRDTLKTTCLLGFVLWVLVKNPDFRILLYSEVHNQSKKRLKVLKDTITTCSTFRTCYGDLCGSKKGYPWNEESATLSTKKAHASKEANIETAGLDVVLNQLHFDLIVADDLHSEENTKTRDQIDKVKDKIKLLMPLISKGRKMLLAGVFWNDNDVHTWVLEEQTPNLYRRSVFVDEKQTISRYPIALPLAELKKKRKFMSEDMFSCHYLLDPVSKESQKFKKEYFQIIPDNMFQTIKTFILIDGAGDPTSQKSEKKDSDFTGIVVVGINSGFDIIIRQMFMGRVSPTEGIEIALAFIMKYSPYVVGVEKAAVGNMAFYLREELRKRGRFAIVEDLMPAGRSKYQRIVELEPLARRRKIFLAQESAHKDDFFDQALKITNGIKAKHDDLIDPLAYILDLLKTYGIGDTSQTQTDRIPPELLNLDPISRDYWMSVRKAGQVNENKSWASEFVM